MDESTAIITLLLVGITTYLSSRAFKSPKLLETLVFNSIRILRDKEYHRVLTSGFIHADWAHLFFNMFSLYSFGRAIELSFGAHILLLIYLLSILGGSLLSLFLHRHEDYKALGASGGVCGVIFAAIFLLPGGGVTIFPLPIAIPSWLYAILFIAVSFFGLRNLKGNIGHDAHLGGAISGLAVTTAIYPAIITQSPVLYLTVITLSIVLLVYSYKHPLLRTPALFYKTVLAGLHGGYQTGTQLKKKQADQDITDRLLRKMSSEGIDGLTASERKQLKGILKRNKKMR